MLERFLLGSYLALVDFTGRLFRDGKAGRRNNVYKLLRRDSMESFRVPWSLARVLRMSASSSRVYVSYRRGPSAARTVRLAFNVVLARSG